MQVTIILSLFSLEQLVEKNYFFYFIAIFNVCGAGIYMHHNYTQNKQRHFLFSPSQTPNIAVDRAVWQFLFTLFT